MKNLLSRMYYNKYIGAIFPTLIYCLRRELRGFDSVLDLGCGRDSPIRFCSVRYSLGIEGYEPYLEESKRKKIHTEYLMADLTKVKLKAKSFDAVILIDVLEHLNKREGEEILEKAERWARKKVIITTPNGYLPQEIVDSNNYQRHRSGWTLEELKKAGFKVRGLAGLKFLRYANITGNNLGDRSLFSSIRFWPKPFWFLIAALSQSLTFHLPGVAFEFFCVKNIS